MLRKIFFVFIISAIMIYVTVAFLAYSTQAQKIYLPDLPSREVTATPRDVGLLYEDVIFLTQDNIKLHGWFIPAVDPRGIILFCHGNAGNISHRLGLLQVFHKMGLSVFIFDYRGYGESEGEPSEKGTYQDAEAAWNFLVHEKKIPSNKIIILGRSLGGPIAAWLAHKHTSGALILESTFTSIPDLAKGMYPYLPVDLLCLFKYKTKEYIENIKCPVLIIHSPEDDFIPFSHGKKLFELADEPKAFLEITGSYHGGIMQDIQNYKGGIDNFITIFVEE